VVKDEGYFVNPQVAGSNPAVASRHVAQLGEHREIPSSPNSPAKLRKEANYGSTEYVEHQLRVAHA